MSNPVENLQAAQPSSSMLSSWVTVMGFVPSLTHCTSPRLVRYTCAPTAFRADITSLSGPLLSQVITAYWGLAARKNTPLFVSARPR